MTAVSAGRYPGGIELSTPGLLPRTAPSVRTLVMALLIVLAALVATHPAPADGVLPSAPPAAAVAEAGVTSHAAAARARRHDQRQLSQCLHRAHQASADPAGCVAE